MKFSVNVLLTCIVYCDAGTRCLIRTRLGLFASTVNVASYSHGYHISPHAFFVGDAEARDALMFFCIYCLCLSSSMYRFVPLFVRS